MTESLTAKTYGGLDAAYQFFNNELFGGTLPEALLTLQRKRSAYGYFSGKRFADSEDKSVDEIALNPSHFATRSAREVLSTLVHEQVHLWQDHFGKPPKSAYHNKEWAAKMKEVGLWPSSTGQEGGKETGPRVSHYILNSGPYEKAYEKFVEQGGVQHLLKEQLQSSAKKTTKKTKYVCPNCEAKVWGKPDMKIICGECSDDEFPVEFGEQ